MTVALSFFQLEIKKVLSYRVEFWLGFVFSVVSQFGVAYFLWKAIFAAQGADRMEGFTFGALMLYYLLVPLVERAVHGQEMGFISGEIYDGGLNKYLIYPVSYFRVKYMSMLAQSTLFFVQLLFALGIFLLIFRSSFNVSALSLLSSIPVLFSAGVLYFSLACCLEMLAFWADNVWSIMVLNRLIIHLLGGALVPLAFFPGWARAALEWLPFSKLVSFPVRSLMGQVAVPEWFLGLALTWAWAGVFAFTASRLWKRGLKSYSGVGI